MAGAAAAALLPRRLPAVGALPAEIPSPTQGVWHLGPVPVRAYALCILAGILVAAWMTRSRLQRSTGDGDRAYDVAMWAVPFGIVGGRLYHVATSWQPYFGPGGHPIDAFKIWNGGLGIWGAVAMGALGAWIGCRRYGVPFLAFGDALAPALPVAQALGRFGNFFNNELYGDRTSLPWGIVIWQWDGGQAVHDADGNPVRLGVFQPTFAYEALWCLLVAAVLLLVERRWRLRRGQLFALYVIGYTLGRLIIEMMRTDPANHVMGMRLNVWTSLVVCAFGIGWFVLAGRRGRAASQGVDAAVSVRQDAAP